MLDLFGGDNGTLGSRAGLAHLDRGVQGTRRLSVQQLAYGPYLGNHDKRILCAHVACRSNDGGFGEASRSELVQESHAFLGTGDSGEPVGWILQVLLQHGFFENDFGDEEIAAGPNNAG